MTDPTVPELALEKGCDSVTIYRAIESGHLVCYGRRRQKRIPRAIATAWQPSTPGRNQPPRMTFIPSEHPQAEPLELWVGQSVPAGYRLELAGNGGRVPVQLTDDPAAQKTEGEIRATLAPPRTP